MTKKEDLENVISDLKEQLVKAQGQLENLEYERFTPTERTNYYFVDANNNVICTVYRKQYKSDSIRYNVYNCFETEEEARKETTKILIRRKLEDIAKRLNNGIEPDWNNYSQCKFHIFYNYELNTLDYTTKTKFRVEGAVYCTNSNFLQEAIKEIGEQELIDYIKGE